MAFPSASSQEVMFCSEAHSHCFFTWGSHEGSNSITQCVQYLLRLGPYLGILPSSECPYREHNGSLHHVHNANCDHDRRRILEPTIRAETFWWLDEATGNFVMRRSKKPSNNWLWRRLRRETTSSIAKSPHVLPPSRPTEVRWRRT